MKGWLKNEMREKVVWNQIRSRILVSITYYVLRDSDKSYIFVIKTDGLIILWLYIYIYHLSFNQIKFSFDILPLQTTNFYPFYLLTYFHSSIHRNNPTPPFPTLDYPADPHPYTKIFHSPSDTINILPRNVPILFETTTFHFLHTPNESPL